MNNESVLKLLHIDNDPIFRTGLKFSCEQFSDIEIVAETEVGSEALKIIQNLNRQEKNFW
jgi:Response regulator containing a CheY-like receiver domain and an HTH DNA-binding domain